MERRSTVVSVRMPRHRSHRLQRLARRLGRTASDTGAMLVEEGLRRSDFAFIDFRDTPVGRQACVQGSTLAVWEVVLAVRDWGGDAEQAARRLGWPLPRVRAALNYAEAYPEEIETAIADLLDTGFTDVARMLPQAERFVVDV